MSRIEDLERRVSQDPASIAFGALAEEYRRAGRLEDAIAACRTGLARHPSYLSARVTLGRALQELGRQADARKEFENVLAVAPDNLAAIRALAELQGGEPPIQLEPISRPSKPPAPAAAPAPVSAPAPLPVRVPASDSGLDLSAVDASLDASSQVSAAGAEREAQIERLEIWLAKLHQAREGMREPSK